MNKFFALIIILLASFSSIAQCGNNVSNSNCEIAMIQSSESKSAVIKAYYFHNSARCITCKTVEAEAKANLESLYGSKVIFQSLNLEDDTTKEIAKKLQVSGQTLLIVKGDQKINLTNEGFMYARNNPEKFKLIIKEKVDKLIN